MKLTKKERRLAVLKDALLQVRGGNYAPCTGTICSLDSFDFNENGEVQKQLTPKFLKEKWCRVCQRGALLLSLIRKENNFTSLDFSEIRGSYFETDSKVERTLMRIFTPKQIALMEATFECWVLHNIYDTIEESYAELNHDQQKYINIKDFEKAIKFGRQFTDRDRQVAILKNAIKNGGIFKP